MLLLLHICFCSVSDNNQADVIETFNTASRYLDDLLNIDYPYFEKMVGQIYPTELQLNEANFFDTEAPFLDWDLPIMNGIFLSTVYDKWVDFNNEIVHFLYLDGFLVSTFRSLIIFFLQKYVLMSVTPTKETNF